MASGGASEPSSWNRYLYVQNDPVNITDVRGTEMDCRWENGVLKCTHTYYFYIASTSGAQQPGGIR